MDLASWQDLIEMKKEHLKQIESEALFLIKEKMKEYQEYTSITSRESMERFDVNMLSG